jgi:streptomycin 6-kinase
MASVLVEHAASGAGAENRATLVANTYLARLLTPSVTPPSALTQLDAIADGSAVPADAARAALGASRIEAVHA